MKKPSIALILLCILGLSCSTQTYQGSLQTAIVQTQTAMPSPTCTSSPVPSPLPTNTLEPSPTSAPSPTPEDQQESAAAEASQEMKDFIAKLNSDKIINTSEGTFYKLKNFEQTSNKVGVGNIILAPTGRSPKQFILRSELSWAVDVGAAGADWAFCAPLIAFYQKDSTVFYYTFAIGVGSPVNLMRSADGNITRINRGSSANLPTPDGKSKIAIVMYSNNIRLFVDEKIIDTAAYGGFASVGGDNPGALSLGMLSGNANGYGTRIALTNVELWEIK